MDTASEPTDPESPPAPPPRESEAQSGDLRVPQACDGASEVAQSTNCVLVWEGMTYRARKSTILKDVSGIIKKGEIVALMGLSGSGKTTMLQCITRQIMAQTGEVRVEPDRRGAPATIGYMPDTCNFFGKATVLDTLQYKARIIMPEVPPSVVQQEVMNIITKLDMTAAKDTKICYLSAGEIKRLSLAAQLLRKPDILILDEPLSGLDSASSVHLAGFLRAMASEGVAVLMSLHQPRPEVYKMMDTVGLMHGGNMVFWGERDDTLPFLETFSQPWKESDVAAFGCDVEPAHRVLDILHSQGGEGADTIAARFNESKHGETLTATIRASATVMKDYRGPSSAEGWFARRFLAGWKLTARHTIGAARTWAAVTAALLAGFVTVSPAFSGAVATGPGLALVLWVIAFQMGQAVAAFNSTGFTLYLFVPYFDVLEGVLPLPVYIALVVVASIFHVLLAVLVAVIMFFTIGIQGPPLLFPTYLAGVSLWACGLFGLVALVMGLETLLHSIFTDRNFHSIETTLRRAQHPVYFMLLGLYYTFSGVLVTFENVPRGFLWVYYTNPATWFIKAVMTVFVCDDSSCGEGALGQTDLETDYLNGILNLDKQVIMAFSSTGDGSTSPVLGLSDSDGNGLSGATDQTLVDQLHLQDGSIASFLGIALATAVAPFAVAYIFLRLHQASLRRRLPGPVRPNASAPDEGQDSAAEDDKTDGRQSGSRSMKRSLVLLAGVAVTAISVMIPVVVLDTASTSAVNGFGFEPSLSTICPTCINGVVPPEELTLTSPSTVGFLLRTMFAIQATRATLLTIPRADHLYVPGSTVIANTSSFNPREVTDFLDITPRIGFDFSELTGLGNDAQGLLLRAVFTTGNVLFYNVKTMPDQNEFPVTPSTSLAVHLEGTYNTTLEEALADGRLYRNRFLEALDSLPDSSLGGNEDYVMMNVRTLLYRTDAGELDTLALQLGRGAPLLVENAMDNHCWSLAKALARHTIVLQVLFEHLGRIHLIGNGVFYISASQNLPVGHPVLGFLDPHMHPLGVADVVNTVTRPSSAVPFRDIEPGDMVLLTEAVSRTFNWTEHANIRNRLEAAGLDNVNDGLSLDMRPMLLLLHDAALEYAEGFVGLTYGDDSAVVGDAALQAFVLGLCHEDYGNIQGLCWGGRHLYGHEHGYPDEPPVASREALSNFLGEAVSGLFLTHSLSHSRALGPALFFPLAPTNIRKPRVVPTPESVCLEQDLIDSFGDHRDWAKHMLFFAQLNTPLGGHITQFRGHYSAAAGGDSLAVAKDELFDTFISRLEGPLQDFDVETGLGVWAQMGAWIYV